MNLDVILKNNFPNLNDKYREFAEQKNNCRCCGLFDIYKQNAQSEGCTNKPTFMFIGESYGADEVREIRPFVGKAGQRLRQEIRKHSIFTKKNTILTNVLSCRPMNNKFPSDKDSYTTWNHNRNEDNALWTKDIAQFCASKWLFREIEMLSPKVIVTVGAQPLKYICNKVGVTENRGEWLFLPKFQAWALPTFHPSYILRCSNDPQKEYLVCLFEQDIKKVADTWSSVVLRDYRMNMDPEEYKRYKITCSLKNKMQ